MSFGFTGLTSFSQPPAGVKSAFLDTAGSELHKKTYPKKKSLKNPNKKMKTNLPQIFHTKILEKK